MSNLLGPLPFRVFANPRAGTPEVEVLPEAGYRQARAEITRWPGYAPTPLRDLPWAAQAARGRLRAAEGRGRTVRARQFQGARRRLGGGASC